MVCVTVLMIAGYIMNFFIILLSNSILSTEFHIVDRKGLLVEFLSICLGSHDQSYFFEIKSLAFWWPM